MAPFACDELAALGATDLAPSGPDERADAVAFAFGPDPAPLHRLRTVTSVQRSLDFDVPRPKALLGDAPARRLAAAIAAVVRDAPEPFRAVRLEAAGSDTVVMRRLRAACAGAAGLPDDPVEGDLRIRVRPAPHRRGWQVLTRLTPRPLSARAWRVANLPGGLNACVAAAAWRMLGHDRAQRVWNPMCGSGTLLIERAALGPIARLVGTDRDRAAVEAAAANVRAAGWTPRRHDARDVAGGSGPARSAAREVDLIHGDATAGPPPGAFDLCVADPPWGDAVGDAVELEAAYEGLARAAAAAVVPGGRFLIVTHALRVWARVAERHRRSWRELRSVRVFHGGHRPALIVYERRPHDGSDPPAPSGPSAASGASGSRGSRTG